MKELEEFISRFEQALLSTNQLVSKEIFMELSKDFSPIQTIDKLIVPALERVGLGWEQGKIALSQVYMGGRICEELVDTILPPGAHNRRPQVKIAIAVLEDYHILGKRIVYSVLRASGFELLDYGHGIRVDNLVDYVKKDEVKILLISTLMLRSALRVKQVKGLLKESNLDTKIIVGGAPFLFDNQLWKEVGADAMGHNASEVITIISELTKSELMMQAHMTSLQRILTTLDYKEPDRVPFFLPTILHGAKELGISLKEYFSRPENVVEAQIRFRARYRHDCVTNFFYSALEVEAWGAEVMYFDDGPPNAGAPIIRTREDIKYLQPPNIQKSSCLYKVLNATRMLREKVDDAPVLGVVTSPLTLPVMQMGFDKYIELMYEDPELFWQLMKVNEIFCVEWANAQLEAGATAIAYSDPVSSASIIPREMYLKTGFEIAKRIISKIKGPTAIHMSAARCLPILTDIAQTGAIMIAASALEDLAEIKSTCKGKLSVLGNLNAIEMIRWTPQQAESAVKEAIARVGPGGGYILSDNHGEIPLQVPEEVLMAIAKAVHTWGHYPLEWVKDYDR